MVTSTSSPATFQRLNTLLLNTDDNNPNDNNQLLLLKPFSNLISNPI